MMQRAGGLYLMWQVGWSIAAWYHDINGLLILAFAAFIAPIVALRLLED